MRKALIPAFLLVLLSIVLGATVFREEVAQAAATLNVFVTNDPAHPVPVDVRGVVETLAGQPANAFSLSSTFGLPVRESCSQPQPAGTQWRISSFAVANASDSTYFALLGVSPDTGFTVFPGAPLPGPVLTGSWVGAPGSPGGA